MTEEHTAAAHLGWLRHRSFTARIVAGLTLGVAIGLFFGERASLLQPFADVYLRLMQMTVLPYLMVALIYGLGRLSPAEGRLLARYGALAMLLIWGVSLAVVAMMPLAFPSGTGGSFFSSSLVEPRSTVAFTDLYVPANPFQALANSVVPAVTLFSAALGVALIGMKDKDHLLAPIDALMRAIARVTSFVVGLTPLGVVPLAAVAAGTLSGSDIARLEVYLAAFLAASVLLGLVLLPFLVSALTPFRMGEIIRVGRDAMLTAFVTSSVFVVLPMIGAAVAVLIRKHGIHEERHPGAAEAVVPVAFNFPTAGKLITLLFVPFAAWLTGRSLGVTDMAGLLGTGVFTYFAKAQVALPFLLDLVGVPHDLVQLYLPTAILTGKFDSAVGAMSLLAFGLLVAAAVGGQLRLGAGTLLRAGGIATLAIGLTVGATRAGMAVALGSPPDRSAIVRSMQMMRTDAPAEVLAGAPADPPEIAGLPAFDRIRARGTLRFAFRDGHLPFTFRNDEGRPVGFDIELATQLARDLGVDLEIVAIDPDDPAGPLVSGEVDIVPGLPHTHHWLSRVRLTRPYMDGTMGLIVPDRRRHEFDSLVRLRRHDRLAVGILAEPDLTDDYVRGYLGPVPYTLVRLPAHPDSLLAVERTDVDVILATAESATAWTLLYPGWSVVVPQPLVIRRPLGFAVAPAAADLADVLDSWLVLQDARGTITAAYDYWVLGRGSEVRQSRWSIGRDVLHWID